MPFQALAAAATLLTVTQHGNRVELGLDHGGAEVMWVSPSTFRFRRVLEGPLPKLDWTEKEAVPIQVEDTASAVRIRSHLIDLTIQKEGLQAIVRKTNGTPLMEDLSAARSEAGGVALERRMAAGTEYYGLGARTDLTLGLRGRSLRADTPFLVSTAGYGEFHNGAAPYRFDFTASDRYRVQGGEIDYTFYYGPTPKEIFEEHNLIHNRPAAWVVSPERFGSWATLKASLLRIVSGAMSAATAPVFDLGIYANAPEELKTRARQLGSLVARVTGAGVETSGFRKQLDTFFGTYVAELQDRGFPVWHPLPFQFPEDAEGARHADEFLLGDEMLIAPLYSPGDRRRVYVPRGVWTNLETNEVIVGPRTLDVESKSLPVWARNGAVVPLDSRNGMALHYFPKLGGEFFLLEGDIADYSQAHAAPALDFIRLEIESQKEREYQWVVHHVDAPASLEFEERQYREVKQAGAMAEGTWFYDVAQRNLQVRVKVKAGEDCIINVR